MTLKFEFDTHAQAVAFEEVVALKTSCHMWYECEGGAHCTYVQFGEGVEDKLHAYYETIKAGGNVF
jgi:hypothetical protein